MRSRTVKKRDLFFPIPAGAFKGHFTVSLPMFAFPSGRDQECIDMNRSRYVRSDKHYFTRYGEQAPRAPSNMGERAVLGKISSPAPFPQAQWMPGLLSFQEAGTQPFRKSLVSGGSPALNRGHSQDNFPRNCRCRTVPWDNCPACAGLLHPGSHFYNRNRMSEV